MLDVMEDKELYLSAFSQFENDLGRVAPSWLRTLHSTSIERFAELGFPGPRDEEWRFTNLAPLREVPFQLADLPDRAQAADVLRQAELQHAGGCRLVFVNGRHIPELSTQTALPAGVLVGNLAALLDRRRDLIEPHLARHARPEAHPFVALNTAFLQDGAVVYLPKNTAVREPIELVYVTTTNGGPAMVHPRALVIAESGSQAMLLQAFAGPEDAGYFTNTVTEVIAGPNVHLEYCKLQREGERAFHLDTLQLHQGRDSNVRALLVTLGGGLVRNEANIVLGDEGCECQLNGLYLAGGRQHVDNRTVIDHAKPHCASHELFKGILDGKAHGVFSGKIIVRPDAQKTDAKQTNQTLLLSDDATINTKPQLEIYADDVKCTHGATVGNLSADALFYLRTRGIGLEAARSLLTFAFANDLIQGLKIESVKAQLEALLLRRQHLPLESDVKEAL